MHSPASPPPPAHAPLPPPPRDGNSGPGTRYPPGTRPDGAVHGSHFSPVGMGRVGFFTRCPCRVRGGDFNPPMGNPVGTRKIEMYFYFQPNVHFWPSPTIGGASWGVNQTF
jgi:hypothetical protein